MVRPGTGIPFFLFLLLVHFPWVWAGEPVKIGLLLPPEQEASFAKPYLWAAEMAVAEINSQEGKQGIQFLLVLNGGPHNQEKDLNRLHEIILEEKIQFLIGAVEKDEILPVSRLAQSQRVPFLAFPLEYLESASTGKEPANLFWISPSPEAFQRAAVRMAAQFPQKRFFLIARESKSGRSWSKYFWEELKRLKPDAQVGGEILLPKKVEDYDTIIREVLAAAPEVCVSHLGVGDWVEFSRRAKEKSYFKKIVHFELESADFQSLAALKKNNPEGVWGISAFPFWALDAKETRAFVAKYRKKNRSYPGLEALSGYVSIYALAQAMKKAGSVNPERVMKVLEGLVFPTPVGSLAIRATDHRALWPIWCGRSKLSSKYPFAILTDLKAFGADSFLAIGRPEEKGTERSDTESP